MARSNVRPVKVAKRSGFDKSHFNLVPAKVGTEVPVLVDEVIGNTSVYCRISLGASMSPLATDTYMNCDIKMEAFYVPFRVLYSGFESFYLQNRVPFINSTGNLVTPEQNTANRILQATTVMPHMNLLVEQWDQESQNELLGSMSLFDYLGGKFPDYTLALGEELVDIQPLPFVAYHMIMNHYYRNKDVETEYFARFSLRSDAQASGASFFATMPYSIFVKPTTAQTFGANNGRIDVDDPYDTPCLLGDGVSIFSLRQRSFGYDYFTNAYPESQAGDAISVDSSSGSFTIASLRAGNALQEFREQRLLPGGDYAQALKADFNANLANGVADRPIFLGSMSFNVYNKTVEVNATNDLSPTRNPFNIRAGGIMGNGRAAGQDVIISGFTAQEPGYIFILAALVPKATYSTGIRRYLRRYTSGTPGAITEMARSSLQSVGNQPIYQWELTGNLTGVADGKVFGYTDRYADFMEYPSEIHGDFKLGGPLEAFASQRGFTGEPTFTSQFLKIPTNYLDNVTAVESQLSQFGYWMEIMFDYKVSMPLAEYSVPSLVDPGKEHGDTVMIHRGALRF